MKKQFTLDDLHQAHMAGQAEAGIDPSYSNAQVYVQELTKPPVEFKEGEVYAHYEDWNNAAERSETGYARAWANGRVKHEEPRKLTTREAGAEGLVAAVEAVLFDKVVTSGDWIALRNNLEQALTQWKQERNE